MMLDEGARIVEVILVRKGDTLTYYTKEGVYIGSFVEGAVRKEKPVQADTAEAPDKPRSGVVKSLNPDEVKREEAKHNEKVISGGPEAVAKQAVEKNLVSWQRGKTDEK